MSDRIRVSFSKRILKVAKPHVRSKIGFMRSDEARVLSRLDLGRVSRLLHVGLGDYAANGGTLVRHCCQRTRV